MMLLSPEVIVGGGAAAAVLALFQAAAPDLIKELGLPIAFLCMTLAGLRVLWKANEKKDERIEALTREFSSTVKNMADEHTEAFNKLAEEFRSRKVGR